MLFFKLISPDLIPCLFLFISMMFVIYLLVYISYHSIKAENFTFKHVSFHGIRALVLATNCNLTRGVIALLAKNNGRDFTNSDCN